MVNGYVLKHYKCDRFCWKTSSRRFWKNCLSGVWKPQICRKRQIVSPQKSLIESRRKDSLEFVLRDKMHLSKEKQSIKSKVFNLIGRNTTYLFESLL